MKLTSHERIMRIFQNREIDRPALKLWGASQDGYLLHPDYRPVYELAGRISDLFIDAYSPYDITCGKNRDRYKEIVQKDTDDEKWKDKHIILHTKEGDLRSVYRVSTVGEPSYTTEYMIKKPEDLKKLLTIEYEPFPFDPEDYIYKQAKVGDRGVVMLSVEHAAYALQRLVGSENLAYFSVDYREEIDEIIQLFSNRIIEFVQKAIDAGFKGIFQWCGPELFIPPLLSPKDFEDFVFKYDKPLCDLIHNAGGYTWVHCHGKVSNFIGHFIEMGVDVLNPLEPPKNGDIDLVDIIEKYGNQIGWEGNIEIQDIIQSDTEHLKSLIKSAVEAGSKSRRFILCPSAGYMEYPFPSEQYIRNLLTYLQYGFECVTGINAQ